MVPLLVMSNGDGECPWIPFPYLGHYRAQVWLGGRGGGLLFKNPQKRYVCKTDTNWAISISLVSNYLLLQYVQEVPVGTDYSTLAVSI